MPVPRFCLKWRQCHPLRPYPLLFTPTANKLPAPDSSLACTTFKVRRASVTQKWRAAVGCVCGAPTSRRASRMAGRRRATQVLLASTHSVVGLATNYALASASIRRLRLPRCVVAIGLFGRKTRQTALIRSAIRRCFNSRWRWRSCVVIDCWQRCQSGHDLSVFIDWQLHGVACRAAERKQHRCLLLV
jgi:hypothetical protein